MWPRLKNSPHTYAHEGLESIFLFEFIELQWVQTDFLRLSDNNNFKSEMFIGSCAGTYNGVVGQQRVAKSFIQELPIGIPPYKEQLRIVSKVNNLFSQLDMIEKIPASISLQG